MASFLTLRGLRPQTILPPTLATTTARPTTLHPSASAIIPPQLPFTTTHRRTYAKGAGGATGMRKKKRLAALANLKGPTEAERKLRALKTNLFAEPPPPLRMGRNRHLRHWTIHRAWLLHQRALREDRVRELTRMQQGMAAACEELRKTDGPGVRPEGYLYRLALEKKGVYRQGGWPIEHTRLETDTPAREAWNYRWKREVVAGKPEV
jgi:large subunit ribosomal protein L40